MFSHSTARWYLCSLSFLCLGMLPSSHAQTSPAQPQIVTINASLDDLFHGYDYWTSKHPHVLPKEFHLNTPILEIYSQDGVLHYFGDVSADNARILDNLPASESTKNINGSSRPSLKETLDMFPALHNNKDHFLQGNMYTVVSITFPHWALCKAHNDAVERLRHRARKLGIRVLEVQLHAD